MSVDPRAEIYRDLRRQQSGEEERTHQSANQVLSIVKEYIETRSVLDVGCGLGTWLQTAPSLGPRRSWGSRGHGWIEKRLWLIPG